MSIEIKTINALVLMGVPVKSKGARYIVESMKIFEESHEWTNIKTTCLYEKIAEKYNTKPDCVERNIRHAFLTAVSKENTEFSDKYLGKNSRGNTNRLATLYIRLKQEAGNEESIY